MKNKIPQPSKLISSYGMDVWSIFSPLASRLNAVNLGQGFPNFPMPQFMKEAASRSINMDFNQYSPPKGVANLRKALGNCYGPLFQRSLDVDNEVVVTAGANEGMLATFMAFLDKDSEIICFEPFFDQYAPNIQMCGAKMVCCPLRQQHSENLRVSSSAWRLDFRELESMISQKTRMIVLNTPHNPTGKVFDREELLQLSEIAIRHNLLVLSDEVYDRLVYPPSSHIRIATLPGMWERTITVGSAGKSFCCTGWRVGWLIGPSELVKYSLLAHSRIVFCANTPLQEAIGAGLESPECNEFFWSQAKEYQRKRDFLVNVFVNLGLSVTVPDGSYFILVNIEKIRIPEQELQESEREEAFFFPETTVPPRSKDWEVCRWLTTHVGVAAIPPSEFYKNGNEEASRYARFCFCKSDETLELAKERLQKLEKYIVS